MWLIKLAMNRPISVLMAVVSIALVAVLALAQMSIDIFPKLNMPVIYVAQPYGGMDPSQMEGYVTSYYEYHFLYLPGIEHVESRSIQNISLVKLVFHPGTDMSQAMSQTVSMVERARAFMPPGTVAPFVMRFDAGSVPVGYLVFSSATRSLGEIQDLALFKVRPLFATLPGVSAPPPFGGNQRTIVIHIDPQRLRAFRMSADEVVRAVSAGNVIVPAGNVRTGDLNRLTPSNAVVADIQELAALPIRAGAGPTVYLRDLASIQDSSDILAGYALVNGRQTVYIPVTKRADASTLAVVNRVKAQLAKMQAQIPDDIKLDFVFDQSVYVTNSLRGLLVEGALGAILTGLMVLLFLRDLRSSLVVVVTIPFALMSSLILLWLAGQTINIMTLGGLTLSVGILVDEATVVMERIHARLAEGREKVLAIFLASSETVTPRLLAMLSVIAVFIPALFMKGSMQALFAPLSLAVGFAMMASYVLSATLVPVLCTWFLQHGKETAGPSVVDRCKGFYASTLDAALKSRWMIVVAYALATGALIFAGLEIVGTEIFPHVNAGQLQLRLRAPTGTRVERTQELVLQALALINEVAGKDNVVISLGYVGTQPPSYPISSIYLWTSGSHEALLSIGLKRSSGLNLRDLQERLRRKFAADLPELKVSFEAGDIVSQVMNFGASNPVEIAVTGPKLSETRAFTQTLCERVQALTCLRDVQIAQPLDYPTINVNINRDRAGQLGVTVEQVGKALVSATSSSRFIAPTYWRDGKTGVAYQVQVEVPQFLMTSADDVKTIPATQGGAPHPLIGDLAAVEYGVMPGEFDRYNMQRMLTITANLATNNLGQAAAAVNKAIEQTGKPPKGVTVNVRGQIEPMNQAIGGLTSGLGLSVLAVFLLLASTFQSTRLALVVVSIVPAILAGVLVAILVAGATLNIQSFIGAIMAVGIGVANAILLTVFAEKYRRQGRAVEEAVVMSGMDRLRPIMMTSAAMIAGMVPLAIGMGEGGEQTAPLGVAVIGGLLASFPAVLIVIPAVFALVQAKASRDPGSLLAKFDSRELEVLVSEAQ